MSLWNISLKVYCISNLKVTCLKEKRRYLLFILREDTQQNTFLGSLLTRNVSYAVRHPFVRFEIVNKVFQLEK